MVAELAKCQQKLGGGYLSAFPHELFVGTGSDKPRETPAFRGRRSTPSTRSWPACCDMYRLPGNRQALAGARRHGRHGPTSGRASKTEEHMQEILTTEFGGMAETLYNLAAVTNNDVGQGGRPLHRRRASSIRWPRAATNCAGCTSTRISRR